MKRIAVAALLALAACGVDGAPQPPAAGNGMSGTVTMGIGKDGG